MKGAKVSVDSLNDLNWTYNIMYLLFKEQENLRKETSSRSITNLHCSLVRYITSIICSYPSFSVREGL